MVTDITAEDREIVYQGYNEEEIIEYLGIGESLADSLFRSARFGDVIVKEVSGSICLYTR